MIKKGPFRFVYIYIYTYIYMIIYKLYYHTVLWGLLYTDKRIPIKQPGFNGKYTMIFFVAQIDRVEDI